VHLLLYPAVFTVTVRRGAALTMQRRSERCAVGASAALSCCVYCDCAAWCCTHDAEAERKMYKAALAKPEDNATPTFDSNPMLVFEKLFPDRKLVVWLPAMFLRRVAVIAVFTFSLPALVQVRHSFRRHFLLRWCSRIVLVCWWQRWCWWGRGWSWVSRRESEVSCRGIGCFTESSLQRHDMVICCVRWRYRLASALCGPSASSSSKLYPRASGGFAPWSSPC
jgi:hypothetical protein